MGEVKMLIVYGVIIGLMSVCMIVSSLLMLKYDYYDFVSNFGMRKQNEQKQLLENGWPQKHAKLMVGLGSVLLVFLIPVLLAIQYAMTLQWLVFIMVLFGGTTYLSRYEVKEKRNRSYFLNGGIGFVLMVIFVSFTVRGMYPHDFHVNEDTFEITGAYGSEWPIEEVVDVQIIKERPSMVRINGIGTPTVSKGYHRQTSDNETVLLFTKGDKSDYLYIEVDDQDIYLNASNNHVLEKWYEDLTSQR